MFSLWRYGAYSHGYLIFPISAYLIWQRRHRLSHTQISATLWTLPLVAGLAFAWFVGELAAANLIRQAAVVALIPTLVCTLMGPKYARALLFPLGFLFFAVPVGDSLIPKLQDFTAWFTVSGLRLTGIPAVLEGRSIYVSSGVWEVAEACSGIRYLISSVALGTLFAQVVYRSWTRRLLFIGASVVVPIVANGLRAYTIVLLAHKVDRKLAVGIDHIIYGWIFFAFVILLLFLLGFRWHEANVDRPTAPHDAEARKDMGSAVFQRYRLFAAGAAILILLIAAIAARQWDTAMPTDLSVGSSLQTVLPWKPVDAARQNEWLKNHHTDFIRTSTFTDGEHKIDLVISYYATQSAQAHLADPIKEQFADAGWIELDERPRKATLNHDSLNINEGVITNISKSRLFWSCYWVDGEFTSDSSRAKLLRAKAKLLRQRSDVARIILLTDVNSSPAEASAILEDFLQHSDLPKMLESPSK